MKDGLELLGGLTEAEIDWIFSVGREEHVPKDVELIKENKMPGAIYIVLSGLFDIHVASLGSQRIATLGPGEITGEMSFLENCPAFASLKAREESRVLAIPRDDLTSKLAEDGAFAGRFYKCIALLSGRRLRQRAALLQTPSFGDNQDVWNATEATRSLWSDVRRLKALMSEADHLALQNGGAVSEDVSEKILDGFAAFNVALQTTMDDLSSESVYLKDKLGAKVQEEFLPYVLLAKAAERFYSKPRGYAGDFWSIELIYQNEPNGIGRLGPVIDRYILGLATAEAARSRRPILTRKIFQTLEENNTAKVSTLACGPANELFDVYARIDEPERLQTNLIDIDLKALAFVSDKRDEKKLRKCMKLHQGNLVYLATGRQQIPIGAQDLVYSLGLIDYFDDHFVVSLLNYVHDLLKPGGTVILGNVHLSCPDRALLDYILEWPLIYRTEQDMNRLFAESKFAQQAPAVRFDDTGIQMFAECSKAGH